MKYLSFPPIAALLPVLPPA